MSIVQERGFNNTIQNQVNLETDDVKAVFMGMVDRKEKGGKIYIHKIFNGFNDWLNSQE